MIVASRHTATDSRVLRMWFAPDLGYVPVQAERSRDGKLEFAMRIKIAEALSGQRCKRTRGLRSSEA